MNKFESDYVAGAHPAVIKALSATNAERSTGYGFDEYSKKARTTILEQCGLDSKSEVHFFVGGTLTNRVLLDIVLESYQAVIATDLSHIFTHESGAIEALGHKVLPLKNKDGKIDADSVEEYMSIYTDSQKKVHIAEPGAVYVTQPTELGTLYTKNELIELAEVCKKYSLFLYLDGARLAYALGSEYNDVTLKDIAEIVDCFYIGGAKCGALLGEAGVIKPNIKCKSISTAIKRHGALVAKGRVVAMQFQTLFTDNLYIKIGHRANLLAKKIYDGMKKLGYEFLTPVQTNQCFVILTDSQRKNFKKNGFDLGIWDTIGKKQVTRIITDWMLDDKDIEQFLDIARKAV